uniref:Uncharacterized protein n=1 Tax=Anguilla anguilla TaxID=7936 RepID=A0A0E9V5G1_ANGAN
MIVCEIVISAIPLGKEFTTCNY